jgi:hypothetical protein
MPARYVDQVQKLEIRGMMAAALKATPSEHYTVCKDGSGWHSVPDHQATAPGHEIIARIILNRAPAKGAGPPWGALVKFSVVGPDGRCREQALWLVATPTRLGRWRWSATCPYRHQSASTLYFAMDLGQFVSRQVAGLKYRRTLHKLRNHRARAFAIRRELETTHSGPWIPKPCWMAEPHYQKLMEELVETDIRWMCKALKRPQPRFFHEPLDCETARPEQVNYPRATAIFYYKNGVRQMKANFRKRYGLPRAAE